MTCAGGLLDYHALQALDFFFSFMAVATVVLYLCPLPWDDAPCHTEQQLGTGPWDTDTSTVSAASSSNAGRNSGRFDEALASDGDEDPVGNVRRSWSTGMRETPRNEWELSSLLPLALSASGPNPTRVVGKGGGASLAALYVFLIPPLLAAVVDDPTKGRNIVLTFFVCGVVVVLSWGRLIAVDMAARAQRQGKRKGRKNGGVWGAEDTDVEQDLCEEEAGARLGERDDPYYGGNEAMLFPSKQPGSRQGIEERGQESKVGPRWLHLRWWSRFCGAMWLSAGRVFGGGDEGSGRVDWTQVGKGAAGFVLGFACFTVQGSDWARASYYLWHSAWHVLAMGSTLPLIRARRWGIHPARLSSPHPPHYPRRKPHLGSHFLRSLSMPSMTHLLNGEGIVSSRDERGQEQRVQSGSFEMSPFLQGRAPS
ncbi:unnamed protein product [Choristocarpus tenellus]